MSAKLRVGKIVADSPQQQLPGENGDPSPGFQYSGPRVLEPSFLKRVCTSVAMRLTDDDAPGPAAYVTVKTKGSEASNRCRFKL